MLRGSLIIFTGLLSVAFLGRRLCWSHWLGMALTVAGLALVGLADLRGSGGAGHGTAGVVTGMLGGTLGRGKSVWVWREKCLGMAGRVLGMAGRVFGVAGKVLGSGGKSAWEWREECLGMAGRVLGMEGKLLGNGGKTPWDGGKTPLGWREKLLGMGW